MFERRDQAGARAGGDVVGRDKLTQVTLDLRRSVGTSKIEALKARLIAEMEKDHQTAAIIEDLQHYHTRRQPSDGIEGLEPKLRAAGRESEILDALEQKERFTKLLARWSLYASAQEIFVHLLSLAVHEFRMSIQPLIGQLDRQGYNELVTHKIVHFLMDEVGDCPLSMDALVTMGLYYWLAEQCFVRWHA
ncbi:MAG: ABC-three component system protein [Acetobacteraceae bacterium]